MLDFNAKKEILRRLQKKGSENVLMRVLCAVAAVFVKIWYGIVCRFGMIFSDKDGNLFGIKGLGRKHTEKKKTRRQDDIVYVKRPFLGRLLSAVLAFSFIAMTAPELGFDLSVFAAGEIGYQIMWQGRLETFYEDTSRLTAANRYFYIASEYELAYAEQVNSVTYDAGYGSVVVNWDYTFSMDATRFNLKGFTVALYDGGGNLLREQVVNGSQQRSYTFTGLGTGDVYAIVYPRIGIQSFTVSTSVDLDPDRENTDVTLNPLTPFPGSNDYVVIAMTDQGNPGNAVTLNARFDPPNIRIITDTGAVTSADIYSTKVNLEWDAALQRGGNAEGTPAAAYNVYVSVNGGAFERRIVGTKTNSAEYTVVQGNHYQFFVEAYRNVWGGDDTASIPPFSSSNPGLISSSPGIEGSSADIKASSIYTDSANLRVHAYVAPAKPVLTITPNERSYVINVQSDPSSGNYSGVFLFRSKGPIPFSSGDIEDPGYDGNFGKWLVDNCLSDNDHVEFLRQLGVTGNNTRLTYPDSDIVEGVTYWYYAVSYLEKDDGTWIYGPTVERQSTVLDLNLDIPLWLDVTTDYGEITLKWEEVSGADGYEIEVIKLDSFTNHDDDETNDEEVPRKIFVEPNALNVGNRTTYTFNRLYKDDRYQYRVRAYMNVRSQGEAADEEHLRFYSEWSPLTYMTVGSVVPAPQNVSATTVDGANTVRWDTVAGATGYTLYWENLNTGESGKFDGLTRNTYTHTNLINGERYKYYVVAYRNLNGDGSHGIQRVDSEDSNATTIRVGAELTIPQDLKATTTDGQVTVSWSKVAGAEGYILEYRIPGQSWDFDVDSNRGTNGRSIDLGRESYNHTMLINGTVYEYRVRAYKTVSGERVYSDPSVTVSITVGIALDAPRDLTVTTTDGSAALKWTASKGAEGYIVHAVSGSTTREFDVSKPQYTHTGLQNGQVWTYYVTAYKTVNGSRFFSPDSESVTVTIGSQLPAPKDFTVTTTDGVANLKWTAVTGAQGYIVYARCSDGRSYQYDVSKPQYTHSNLINGETWTYYVVAYKNVNGSMVYSDPTQSVTITVGVSMAAPVDLVANAGNRQVILTWSAVTGAQGYVVYLYNEDTMEYEPIAVTSKPTYTHLGLKNGVGYTYMVAAFKTINGTRVYGEYSMPVTAVPTSGSLTDIDRELTIKGTAPYGISHGEYISAGANHAAFDESVDVYFTTNEDSAEAVREVLRNYANGLSSFIIYPFDISIYKENTFIEVSPNRGYSVTITMPIPDRLIAYRDYITIVHINQDADVDYITDVEWYDYTDRRLEVLPAAILDIDNVWCVQFECTSFSPYAIVIYKDHLSDVSAGGGVMDGIFAGNFNSGVLLFTALPDILPNNRKLKIVSGGKKRYRIKSIEKRDV